MLGVELWIAFLAQLKMFGVWKPFVVATIRFQIGKFLEEVRVEVLLQWLLELHLRELTRLRLKWHICTHFDFELTPRA